MRVFMYILRWSKPDECEQGVPYAVDTKQVFFGPCKRHLRALLRSEYLGTADYKDISGEELYVVGLNGRNRKKTRKIIWAGHITSIMTFAHAWITLTGARYEAMRNAPFSPLHLEPILSASHAHIGYRHVGALHKGEWLRDLSSADTPPQCTTTDNEARISGNTALTSVFDRDACLLLERLFFATQAGIDLDEPILDSLRRANFLRADDSLDAYAVFGHRSNRSADGKTGWWVEIAGAEAAELITLIRSRSTAIPQLGLPPASSHNCDCTTRDLASSRTSSDCYPAGLNTQDMTSC